MFIFIVCFLVFRYSKQSFIVDLVFPPFIHGAQNEVLEDSEYNEFTYWKQPFPETPDEVEAAKFITVYTESNTSRKRRTSRIDKKLN